MTGFFVLMLAMVAYADVQERVIDLPEDGNKWFTSLFLHDQWQSRDQDSTLVNAFETDRRLVNLSNQTIFNKYTESDPHYRETFAAAIPDLPAIAVQRPDGTIVYKASGSNIPRSGPAIADSIQRTSRRRCWRGQCEPDNTDVRPDERKREEKKHSLLGPIPDLIDLGTKAVATKRLFEGPLLTILVVICGLFVFFLGYKAKD
ncbi:MAG: hypothetical protein ABIK07_15725 [Planctomycetota bacterium]